MPNEVSLVVSAEGLNALADMALSSKQQAVLDDMLARNAEGKLSEVESQELDLMLRQIDELNLVKAQAAVTLKRIQARE